MEPIRVLNLFTIMNRGGAETMVMNYYRHIDRTKIQFDFLVHREEEGDYEEEIRQLGGRIYRMIPIYPQNFSKYKKMLREFFREHKEYQIIHSHMSELGYFAFKEAKRQGIPVRICHAHNAPHGWDLKMIMREYFKKRMMPYITHMFMCGIDSGRWLFGKENEEHFIQMNNAVDSEKFRYNPAINTEVREELGILENQLVIGHVGRFNKQKNHEFLIEIFDEVQKIEKNAVLLLIGQGELEEKIQKKVEELNLNSKVRFLGLRRDVERVMQCFDAFLFPSLFEGLPVTMIESQAAGNLNFISDRIPTQCCITDTVEVIPLSKSAKEWAEIMIEKIANFEKKDRKQEIIDAKFDIKESVSWLEDFYINAARG